MAEKTTVQRVLDIIADQIGERPDNISPAHEMQIDLNCDSLDLVEIMMAMETEFEIEIDDDQFIPLVTVQQVIDHIAEVVAGVTRPTGEPK